MFRHNLRKRGVAMVEYAVLLAFVTTIGGLFIDDSKLNTAIQDNINRVVTFITGNSPYKLQVKENAQQYQPILNQLYDSILSAAPQGANFEYIKIHQASQEKGGGITVEYKYPGQNRVPGSVDFSFLSDNGFSFLDGDTFIHQNADGTIGVGYQSAATRIMLRDINAKKNVYLRYDPDENSFYDNQKYFASPNS